MEKPVSHTWGPLEGDSGAILGTERGKTDPGPLFVAILRLLDYSPAAHYRRELVCYTRQKSTKSGETPMSDTFKEREKSFEAKYKLDEELQFKAESRRNKLLGHWAAEKLGMTPTETTEFAKQVVMSDMAEPGIEDIVGFVKKAFVDRGVTVDEGEIRVELERLMGVALEQLKSEYPEALSGDHG